MWCGVVCVGMYGQLGHGNTEKQSSPRMVEQLTDKTVYLLACGNFHTVNKLVAVGMVRIKNKNVATLTW